MIFILLNTQLRDMKMKQYDATISRIWQGREVIVLRTGQTEEEAMKERGIEYVIHTFLAFSIWQLSH